MLNRLILDAEFTKRRLDQRKFEDVRDQHLTEVSPVAVNREVNLISSAFKQAPTLGAYYRALRAKAGLKAADLRFHDSRHEGTTRLAKKLPNVLVLSAATGHRI